MNPLFYNFASTLPLFIEMGPQNGFESTTVVRISWTFNRYSMPGNNDVNKIDIYFSLDIYIYQVVTPKMINTVIIHYIIPLVGHVTFHYL